jgi:hypothetical protein
MRRGVRRTLPNVRRRGNFSRQPAASGPFFSIVEAAGLFAPRCSARRAVRSPLRTAFYGALLGLADLLAQRQRADPLAVGGEDGIEERWSNRGDARFAHSAQRHVEAMRHDMHMSRSGRVTDAQTPDRCRFDAKGGERAHVLSICWAIRTPYRVAHTDSRLVGPSLLQ